MMIIMPGNASAAAALIDRVVADPAARDAAKIELLKIEALDADSDAWTRRARPAFLYVMYALLLWSIPMGLIAAVRPAAAAAIAQGMTAYLNGIPEPLYALFGTGYLGYTMARSWGKARGVER
jgi:hypothetical protein